MRVREMTMADYGFTDAEAKELYARCLELTEPELAELKTVSESLNPPGLASFIVDSLTEGRSYDAISAETYIPIKRDDFYAYRRRTLAEFYARMLQKGWEPLKSGG